MEGKIVKISDYLGFIEYDIDKRISFNVHNSDFKLGDIVDFDIVLAKIDNSESTYNQAKINKIISKQQPVDKNHLRLSKAARKLNIGIITIINVLYQNGFEVSNNPNTKITEEQFKLIEKHLSTKKKVEKNEINEEFDRGTVIETQIEKIIYPSLIVLSFTKDKKAYLELRNLAWNIARAENTFNNLKENDSIQVVILENKKNHIVVSRKHLLPKPNESNEWRNLSIGEKVSGTIQEILVKKLIVKTDNDFYAISTFNIENNNEYSVGSKLDFILQGKDEINHFLNVSINIEEILEDEEHFINEDFQTQDIDLVSYKSFKKSTYYSLASKEDKQHIERLFLLDNKLFSSAVELPNKLFLNFGFNTSAYESDFRNSLIPYLGDNTTEKEALSFLSEQRYWVRINTWIDKSDGSIKNNWLLFNEEVLLSGFATSETEECDFIITNLSIKRTKKKSSRSKENSLNNGTFLLNSKVTILSPYDSKPADIKQKHLFTLIQNKVLAFHILNRLKVETGVILRDAGLSIAIFDKFLEYQEAIERKGKDSSRVQIETYNQVPHSKTDIAIQIERDIEDLFGGESDENLLVTLKTEEKSHKEKEETELVWFCDAFVENTDTKTKLHLIQLDKPLELLKKGFTVERKISLRQFQVQREVIKDFFDKKLKLDHIESLLVRPEKITQPIEEQIEFINNIIAETEKKQPENNQVKAVKKAVGNNNIFLIQGPPGTGKTTVIAEVVEQLVKKGEKVLVTSQTHIAVDNVLEKVSENKSLVCLRLGNNQRIKENLLPYQIDNLIDIYSTDFEQLISINISLIDFVSNKGEENAFSSIRDNLKEIIIKKGKEYTESFKDVLLHKNYEFLEVLSNTDFKKLNDIKEVLLDWKTNIIHEKEILIKPLLYRSVDVVFATCIGIRTDREINEYGLKFDTVIIDEAGKANISESLAAISMSKKVILVGDQMQLPPYIDGSLLDENESNSFPMSKYGHQYLKEDIQHALKTSFFEFLIKRIEENQFPRENIELLNYQHRMHPHIGEFISDSFYDGRVKMGEHTIKNTLPLKSPFDKEVVFINTSSAQKPFESFDGFSARNDAEAYCISNIIVPKLFENGLTPKDFAVIAPYKSQVAHLKKSLKSNIQNSHLIDVSTLDSFQGMEFDVIIFSFTRAASPEQRNKKVGFLDDARRLNVAFSRAKKKLILIGNSETLTDSRSHFDSLFNYTDLFRRLVYLSKKEKIGNFVNLTDFKNLKSNFQLNVGKLEVGKNYPCKLKLTFEKPNYLGHIFYINNCGIEGMFRDGNKEFEYHKEEDYQLYITHIDKTKESVFLSPQKTSTYKKKHYQKKNSELEIKLKKLHFFQSISVGDILNVIYTNSIEIGHFFEIEPGFNGFFYDPQMKKNHFEKGNSYKMRVSKIEVLKGRVNLSIPYKK